MPEPPETSDAAASATLATAAPTTRGNKTRLALIEAGLSLFGEYGFKGTSTRMLAEAAGANISAIPYHFGGKRGLYRAVVAYIGERIGAVMAPAQRDISADLAAGKLDHAGCEAALKRLLLDFAHLFVEAEEPRRWILVILREQSRPTDAFDTLYAELIQPLHSLVAALIARCVGLDPAGAEAAVRAHALIGQVLVFLSSREAILRRLGVSDFQPGQARLIDDVLWGHARACLRVAPVEEDTP